MSERTGRTARENSGTGTGFRTGFLLPSIYLLVVFLPVLVLLYKSANHWSIENWTLLFPTDRRLTLLGKSILLSLTVAAITVPLGVSIGLFFRRYYKGALFHLRWLILAILIIPPEVHALSWNIAIASIMGLLGVTGWVPNGWWTLVWVRVSSLIPVTAGLAILVLESLDREKLEASRIFSSELKSVLKIILPMSMPVILAASGIVFVLSITDTTLPVLFQQNVYSFELFSEFSSGASAERVFLMSIPLILVAGLIIFFTQSGIRQVALTRLSRDESGRAAQIPIWVTSVLWTSFALLVLFFIIPITALIKETGNFGILTEAFRNSKNEITTTIFISMTVGLLAVPLAIGGAALLKNQSMWLLVLLPLTIPAPLVGIGLIETWNHPALTAIYRSNAMPVMASLARFVPLASILVYSQFKQIDRELLEASLFFSVSKVKRWLLIYMPLMIPGIIISIALVFTLTASELGSTILVAPAGSTTLMMTIYNYMHYGSSSSVAALSLLLLMLSAVGILAILMAGKLIIGQGRMSR